MKQLETLSSRLQIMKAITPRGYKPHINNEGEIDSTGFLQILSLKVGARVMLISNVDTKDRLSNGTCGYVRGFVWSKSEHPEIMKVRFKLIERSIFNDLTFFSRY